ncbi:iron-containing alcohol dehydrogenase [Candidatus Pacearchaeota archaeon]|nr:iron-containing alcohol dehydrogenase [Candidatus Pacearchaeota archaeon]
MIEKMKSCYIPEIHIGINLKNEIIKVFEEKPDIVANQDSIKIIRGFIEDSLIENQAIYLAKDFDSIRLKNFIHSKAKSIVAMGGGAAIDIVKYISFLTKKRLIVIPTILSTNAFATSKICSKEIATKGSIEAKIPDKVIISLEIIKKADKRFNIAGAGDILSIYTANYDWKLYDNEKPEEFDEDNYNETIANVSLSLLNSLEKNARQIKEHTYEGLESLAQLLILSGYITSMYGNGRPESGSEHLFANSIELNFNNKFLHGELVALGTLIMSYLQNQDVSYIMDIINIIGLPRSLTEIGLTFEEIIDALIKAKDMKKNRYTILHKLNLSRSEFENIIKELIKKNIIME